jgi:lysophospholipid acyltransferase (LPLAT)-like uncharacterized protein
MDELRSWFIGWIGYIVISIIGRTIRWESEGDSHLEDIHKSGHPAIFAFWHGRIFGATYYFRRRGIVVMTSLNRDGDAIAQCIRRLGYGTARGSSSRGGRRALSEMAQAIRQGYDCGFSIDGPRGPRYVAKLGPLLLALKTGSPIFCFHVSMKHKVQLNSWDAFQIPLPFTRAVVLQAPAIWVPPDASKTHLRDLHQQVQAILDKLRNDGDSRW